MIVLSINILSTVVWIGIEIDSFIKGTYNPSVFYSGSKHNTILNVLQIVPLCFIAQIHLRLIFMALSLLIIAILITILNIKSFMKVKRKRIIIETLILDIITIFLVICVYEIIR